MVNAIVPMDPHGKLQNVAFAIPNSTLRRVVPWLQFFEQAAKQAQVEERVNRSQLRLREVMRQCLVENDRARQALADVLGDTQLSRTENVQELITRLIDPQTKRLAIVGCLEALAQEFRSQGNLSGREAINGLFAVLAPYCMDRKYAEQILLGLGVEAGVLLTLPWESLTLFEFVMAAIDGRGALFDSTLTDGVPKPRALLDDLPETGFSIKACQDDVVDMERILEHVRQSIGRLAAPFHREIHTESKTTVGRLQELNDDLQVMHTNSQTPFLNAATTQRKLEPREIAKIRKALSYLALVDLVPPPGNGDQYANERALTTPVRARTLLPLPEQAPPKS
jgi:hypothetical protein